MPTVLPSYRQLGGFAKRADPKEIVGYPGMVTFPLSPTCIAVAALYTLAVPAACI